MLDLTTIRSEPDRVAKAARDKNVEIDIQRLLKLDTEKRGVQGKLDAVEQQRNDLADTARGGKPSAEQVEKGKQLKSERNLLEAQLKTIDRELMPLLEQVPNLPTEDTPVGNDASENVVLRKVGEIPKFNFQPKEHWELGESLEIIDSETASRVSGSRFAYLKGELVWLEFALIQHALTSMTGPETLRMIIEQAGLKTSDAPFLPVLPPVLMKPEVMQKMGRLEPRDQRYHTAADNLYLIGSAEHTLGPMHMKETFAEEDLPRRYVGFSTAFRREAGSYGKDLRGILRMHQFDKIEMESFALPEFGIAEQDLMVAIQEFFMQSLKLPYQVVLKCTADMGTPNARGIDIETWMPGQNQYRETHSADYMSDFQARRLNTKVKRPDGKKELVHMNDATVFAIGRTLIAILENYQQADGSIQVPEVLRAYVPFREIVKKA